MFCLSSYLHCSLAEFGRSVTKEARFDIINIAQVALVAQALS
jgi:hypothetical protein